MRIARLVEIRECSRAEPVLPSLRVLLAFLEDFFDAGLRFFIAFDASMMVSMQPLADILVAKMRTLVQNGLSQTADNSKLYFP